MASDTYTDIAVMHDGSYRWLWKVIYLDRLYRAGIAMSFSDSEQQAREAYRHLLERLPADQAAALPPADQALVLDLDRVERGDAPPVDRPA